MKYVFSIFTIEHMSTAERTLYTTKDDKQNKRGVFLQRQITERK